MLLGGNNEGNLSTSNLHTDVRAATPSILRTSVSQNHDGIVLTSSIPAHTCPAKKTDGPRTLKASDEILSFSLVLCGKLLPDDQTE